MRRIVTEGAWTYTISPDLDLPAGALMSAIVSARLVDEISGEPPRDAISIDTDAQGLTSRVAQDGLVGLAAIPRRAFPALRLQAYVIPFEIAADGFVPVERTVTLGPQAGFPGTFSGINLGQLDLHREPVVLRGRVTELVGLTATPIGGAAVRVTGIWRTPPPATVATPPDPPNLVSLRPRVYFDRTAAAGLLRRRELVPVVGDSRVLIADAKRGETELRVSNRVGVVAGDILLVDTDAPDLSEYLTVLSVAGASTPDQPATVTVTYPLRITHQANVEVRRVTPQPPGANNAFAAATIPGDSCVLLNSLTGLAAANVVESHGGLQPAEYHLLSRFEATTDASGYYRLPPISRVAQLNLEVNDGVHPPQTQTVSLDYGLVENRVDFSLV